MAEYIFDMGDALCNTDTGEAVFKPKVVGEVVRCRDCKHYDPDTGIRCLGECEIYDGFLVAEYGFCHHGERKDGEQE